MIREALFLAGLGALAGTVAAAQSGPRRWKFVASNDGVFMYRDSAIVVSRDHHVTVWTKLANADAPDVGMIELLEFNCAGLFRTLEGTVWKGYRFERLPAEALNTWLPVQAPALVTDVEREVC